jgi:hypothetical protein
MPDARASGAPHGSPAGFDAGCRTAAVCPHHRSPGLLTCAEAARRRRGDYRAALLPSDQPLPRTTGPEAVGSSTPGSTDVTGAPVHGTVYGYRRGCRERRACPHWEIGRVTCADARRAYFAAYHRNRLAGAGTPVRHGTSGGYLAGCRDETRCPGDEDGLTCVQARSRYRIARARAAGTGPPPAVVGSEGPTRAIAALRGAGFSLRRIAEAAGVGRATVAALAAGRSTHVRERTATRLMDLAERRSVTHERG